MALLSHATIGQTMLAVYNLHLESRGGDDLRCSQRADVLNETLGSDHYPLSLTLELRATP